MARFEKRVIPAAAPGGDPEEAAPFFEWRNLSVEIAGKAVVQPQSGHALPGELFAILGPSGAGKTSLLSLLCGDREPSTGSVLFQGQPLASAGGGVRPSVRRQVLKEIAYVRQKDIFMEALTVEETLVFTARLRMPAALSRADKLQRVREVISELGLESCAQTTIGSTMRRGVSGGELKRVNIANELLAAPQVLVCDEPTSGLDSACALSVMRQLKSHAKRHGIALLCSIHQPSSQIGALFDTALLLVPGGRDVYLGPAALLGAHLASCGFALPESGYTLTDHAMELLAHPEHAKTLGARWQAERHRVAIKRASQPHALSLRPAARAPTAGFCEQVAVLMARQVRQSKGTLLSRNELLLSVLVALVTGLVWFGAARPSAAGEPPSERALLGFVFFCLAHMSWWPMYLYLFSFSSEVAVLAKEKRTGAYSVEAYFLGKSLSEFGAELACPSLFFAICLPMVGFSAYTSLLLWLVGLLAYQTSSGLGMLVSVAAAPSDANMVASCSMTLMMNCGGFLIDTAALPAALSWLPYSSYWYYMSAVCAEAVFGEPRAAFSPLGFGPNLAIACLFALALRVSVYAALKTSRKYNFN